MIAIEAESASKRFRRQTIQPHTTLESAVMNLCRHRNRSVEEGVFQVLRDITFTVRQGQVLGIIGRNGSRKSTLLKLLAGIYRPDRGTIRVGERVGALLELGAGFHPEFSGRENVLINGIVLSLSKREVRQCFDEIVQFAELETFIDEPVKTSSSGMYVRLGFAVTVHAAPDILLVDEILVVGDETFQQKCFDKLAAFRRLGKTIVLVSHDLATVERWSDEALWLDHGVLQERREPRRVIDLYREGMMAQEERMALAAHHHIEEAVQDGAGLETSNRWGSQEVTIVAVQMLDAAGEERYVYRCGEPTRVVIHYRVHCQVEEPVFGLAILRGDGLRCYGSNADIEEIPLPPLGEEGTVEIFLESLFLIAGAYFLDVAVHARNGYSYDYHHQMYSCTVQSELRDTGVCRIPHRWVITPLLSVPR